jgi:hypothetical protein
VLAENALLPAPRNLFANGKPIHVIKVSAEKSARDLKSKCLSGKTRGAALTDHSECCGFELVTSGGFDI